jgi:hypothetical protein
MFVGVLTMTIHLNQHYDNVIRAITMGRFVPFLGAGGNLYERPKHLKWAHGRTDYLPSGSELAAHLAETFNYPAGKPQDLTRVSQHASVMSGTGQLYDEMHVLFDADYKLTPLHRFFATLPCLLREKGYPRIKGPNCDKFVIVTTNYDDVLERAFNATGEPFHLVCYLADGPSRGEFFHQKPDGTKKPIKEPNEYLDLSLDPHPVIWKIHGTVDRPSGEENSFVITEDHYIDYLTRTDISKLLPVTLKAKLVNSHILFLGYSLSDWNLRVLLRRVWEEQKFERSSWSIQLNSDEMDQRFWQKRGVEIINQRLEHYIPALDNRVQALPPVGGI